MSKKVVLITGTSSGVGLNLSVILAKRAYKVYATMRNLDKKDNLLNAAKEAGVKLELKQLDVQDSASIAKCVDEIIATEGKLDVLVNNAGAGFIRTTEQASEEDIQWVIDVNLTGVIRCTKAVLPHMRKARSGRVVNISSVGGLVGQPFNEIYCAAKFAVEGYTESLATYVQPNFNIKFTSIEPGGIATEFANNLLEQFQSTGGFKDDEYKPILDTYLGGARKRAESGASAASYQSSEEVALVTAGCIDMDNPPIRMRTSEWSEDFTKLKTQSDPDGMLQQADVIKRFLT